MSSQYNMESLSQIPGFSGSISAPASSLLARGGDDDVEAEVGDSGDIGGDGQGEDDLRHRVGADGLAAVIPG